MHGIISDVPFTRFLKLCQQMLKIDSLGSKNKLIFKSHLYNSKECLQATMSFKPQNLCFVGLRKYSHLVKVYLERTKFFVKSMPMPPISMHTQFHYA